MPLKILMVGLGSIGQRHLRNFVGLYGSRHHILAYRVRGLQHTFSADMKIREGVNLESEYNIQSFRNLHLALEERPDVAFITNITSEHISCAIAAAEAGCDLFLEKPLSYSLEGIDALSKLVSSKRLIAFVGFQNRYHPCIVTAKRYLQERTLGRLISVEVEMGERLETMHSYENYSSTYMARRDMGGGVILNQEIHELDYIQWLFGLPDDVYSVGGNSESLNIDVEDNCTSIYSVQVEGRTVPVAVHADFFQSPPSRRCKIIGEYGQIEFDLLNPSISLCLHGERAQITKFNRFQRNDMFLAELKDFIESVRTRKVPAIPLHEGVYSMRMALAAKKSLAERRIVRLEEIL